MVCQHAGGPVTAAAALAPTPETLSRQTRPSPKNKKNATRKGTRPNKSILRDRGYFEKVGVPPAWTLGGNSAVLGDGDSMS